MVQEDVEYMNRLDNAGSITLYTGAMFSGKRKALLHLKTIISKRQAIYIVMRPPIETRYNRAGESAAIVSHNQDSCEALPVEKGSLLDLYPEYYWRAAEFWELSEGRPLSSNFFVVRRCCLRAICDCSRRLAGLHFVHSIPSTRRKHGRRQNCTQDYSFSTEWAQLCVHAQNYSLISERVHFVCMSVDA